MEYAIEIIEDEIGVTTQTVSLHELLMLNEVAEHIASVETKAHKKITIWVRKKAGLESLFDYVFDPLNTARIGKTRIYFFGQFESNGNNLHLEINNVNLIHVSSLIHENSLK